MEIATHVEKWLPAKRLREMIEGARFGAPQPTELAGSEKTKDLFRQAGAAWTLLNEVKRLQAVLDQKQAEIEGLRQNVSVREQADQVDDSRKLVFAHQALIWADALMGHAYGISTPETYDHDEADCAGNLRDALRKYALAIGAVLGDDLQAFD